MSSRSANDRYRPDSGVSWIDGMPPRSRNQRTPTGPDTPHAIAASSLESPSAIFIQNPRSTSRRTGGRPGDRIAGRPVSVTIHPRGRPIQHLHLEMLRRPVEFTLCAAVLAVACSAAFGRTAGHGFLFWDDRAFIAENPLIAHPSAASLLALWTTPLEDLYAPLTYTLWGLLAAVVGPKPWAFHLTNVALHALNGGLVFAVLRRLVTEDDGRAALAGALLFALHPVQSEAVAWASETKDLLSALFSLLAIRQYLVFRERENRRAYLWASGAFACALLAKPSAVVAPALLVILNRGIHRRGWAGSLRGLIPWFVAAAAFTLIAARVQPAAGHLHFASPIWLRPAIALY